MTALPQGPGGTSSPRPSRTSCPAPVRGAPDTGPARHGTARPGDPGVFGRVVGWTLLGSLVPGWGLLAAGRRRSGRAVLALTALVLGAAAITALAVDPVRTVRRWLADPNRFVVAAAVLAVLVLVWAVLVVVTHVSLRRSLAGEGGRLTRTQSVLGGALVTAVVAAAAAPTAFVGADALAARNALTSVFGNDRHRIAGGHAPQHEQGDPWASIPRVNVLLIGSDAGADRQGVRPDTLVLASIDTRTGGTVLISLPRNLQRVPFPPGSPGAADFPDGFQCTNPQLGVNTECLLNGLWVWGDNHPAYYPDDPHPGLTATIQGVEQVTGLKVDQYAMVNLRGFQQLVDIMGGLTVNVTERLPVGGSVEHPVASSWLEPGRQKLDGYLALWYARSRWSTTDYDRMRRQRCVIGDFVDQLDPVTLALKFSQVATAMKENLQTSVPLRDLDAWVTLAERVKNSHVRSLAFTDQVIDTVHPDVPRMHQLVQEALQPPATSAGAAATAQGSPSGAPAPSTGTAASPSGTAGGSAPAAGSPSTSPTVAQDVENVC